MISGPLKPDLCGQVVFLWSIGSRATTRKRLLQDWTRRSAVIKCQSLISAISLMLWSAAQGIVDPKSNIFFGKLYFFGPWGSG